MDDSFVRALKAAVVAEVETTVTDHSMTNEPGIFYIVGESLGGWARYHVRADMIQGQVDEGYYNNAKAALLTFQMSVRDLANFAIPNDTAYRTAQPTMGQEGGYPGAVMGNFFGNHDQVRALTEFTVATLRTGGALVVAGDFNLTEREPAYRDLTAVLDDVRPPGATWRPLALSWLPAVLRVVYLFVSPPAAATSARVECGASASDHCAVVARLRLG
jgi:hypothetical protein